MHTLSELVQNELLWLPSFEFQEITAGRFEKSVGGEAWKGLFVFMEDFVKYCGILMSFVTYISHYDKHVRLYSRLLDESFIA